MDSFLQQLSKRCALLSAKDHRPGQANVKWQLSTEITMQETMNAGRVLI